MYILYTDRRRNGEYILEPQRTVCLYRPVTQQVSSAGTCEATDPVYMYFFRTSSIRAFGTAPTIWSTGFPFLKTSRVGIAMMSNLPDVPGLSSVFSFPKATFPLYSFASPSITGETIRQGPHQGAQQSTSIKGYLEMNESKLESLTSTGESGESVMRISKGRVRLPRYMS